MQAQVQARLQVYHTATNEHTKHVCVCVCACWLAGMRACVRVGTRACVRGVSQTGANSSAKKCLSSAKLRSTDSVSPRAVLSRVRPRYRHLL